jgi:2-hydroxychromene-2-carboxylate isomerase
MAGSDPAAAFYFDLASPWAYIAAERVLHVMPGPCEWRPVLARELAGAEAGIERGADVWSLSPDHQGNSTNDHDAVESRAAETGMQPIVWPDPFPFDSRPAMLAATYARQIGRAVAFAQAAFRQAFAAGHALSDIDFVLIAAAACEMHPNAVLRALETRSVAAELEAATAAAAQLGVDEVPAVLVDGAVFVGESQLERAAAAYGVLAR